jgi:hypothetical protein
MADNRPTKAMVRSASDPEQVQNARVDEKVRRANELADMRAVLSTRAGRNVLWRQLSQCGLFETITVQSSEIYVRSGRRDAGLALIAEITTADPEAYILMQREAARLEQNRVDPTSTVTEESQ